MPRALFAVVAEQVAEALRVPLVNIVRFEDDGTVSERASFPQGEASFDVGTRWSRDGTNVVAHVLESAEPARIEDYRGLTGEIAAACRRAGIRSTVSSPIVVASSLWGVIVVSSLEPDVLPGGIEARLAEFTKLLAAGIANGQARGQLQLLAAEHAALRRVATLVARGMEPEAFFEAVTDEARALLDCDISAIVRFEPDGTVTLMGAHNTWRPPGVRLEPDPHYLIAAVRATGRAARFDTDDPMAPGMPEAVRAEGIRAALASPIIVDGALWGTMTVGTTRDDALGPETESRLAQFTELMAMAVANTESCARVERLAEEQAALRRVATLVAEGASPTTVFDAAAAELGALLHAHGISLCRYEPGDELTVVAHLGPEAGRLPPGTRVRHDSKSVTAIVRRTQRPGRLDSYAETGGTIGNLIDRLGFSAGVGAPIVVDGRLWGVMVANWTGGERPPLDTEQRMAEFTELLGTAIANADGRDQLTASRARLLTEADEARRRVVRDLHDGAQQRLVHTIVTLKLAQQAVKDNDDELESLLGEALEQAEQGNRELRDLAHGILPPALIRGGLRGAVGTVVERLALPIDVDVLAERLPPEIEATAYFIVAEALTNVVKHSRAARAEVTASMRDGMLDVRVRDDGVGAADPDGHGLVGMKDRVAALGGRFEITSPAGAGTSVAVTLPLAQRAVPNAP